MPNTQKPVPDSTRRPLPSLPSPGPNPGRPSGLEVQCTAWRQADGRLEALTLEWDRTEAELFQAARPEPAQASRLSSLERQIDAVDQERSRLLDCIRTSPAASLEAALAKLSIAERLLDGEGGAEHDLVADVLLHLRCGA